MDVEVSEHDSDDDMSRKSDTKPKHVKLCNIPEDVDEEYLHMYFEDEDTFGNIAIALIRKTESSCAIIEFENANDVDSFLAKEPFEIEGQQVTAKKEEILVESIESRTVEVTGSCEVINERKKDTLKLYFKNKRSGGGDIVECDIVEEGIAYITFRTSEAAKRVVDKPDHQLKKQQLKVGFLDMTKKKERENSKTIKMTNIPPGIDESFIKMYFEDEDIFDEALNALNVELDEKEASAIVEFEKRQDVLKVMAKQPLVIDGENIPVKIHIPDRDYLISLRTVEVRGPPDVVNEKVISSLKLYFKNKKYSDGGPVENCFVDQGVAYITFESHEVAKRVVQKGDHKFKAKPIQVEMQAYRKKQAHTDIEESDFQIPEKDVDKPKTILFKGVTPEIQDTLEIYLEELFPDIQFTPIVTDEDKSTVVLEVDDPRGVDLVLNKQKPIIVEGVKLEAELYTPMMNTIEVKGLPDIESQLNILKAYFKNERRSGGGEITNASVNCETNSAYITFASEEVTAAVVQTDSHILAGHRLDVKLVTKEKQITTSEKQPEVSDQPNLKTNEQSKKLLVHGVTEELKHKLDLYIEWKFENITVINVEIDDALSMAVIELNDSSGSEEILKSQPLVIDGKQLMVERYKLSTIEVTGISDIASEIEWLKQYFELPKRSGGGKTTCKHVNIKANVAFFTFVDEEVAQRVVAQPEHTYKGSPLNVRLHDPKMKEETLYAANDNEDSQPTKLLIFNLPDLVDKSFLQLYFEDSEKFGEVQVQSVELNTGSNRAIVEFDTHSAVESILRNCPLKFDGHIISVESYTDSKTVEVRGLQDIGSQEEKLRLYFSNRKRSGGGPITKFSTDKRKNVAYITFKENDVAQRVEERDHREESLDVSLLKTGLVSEDSNVNEEDAIRLVKIEGVTDDIEDQTVECYFANKKFGGGDIESMEKDSEDCSVLYITYMKAADAKSVAERRTHVIQNHNLIASMFVPPPFYENRVLIKGLKSTTSVSVLFNFLEAKTGSTPKDITYHEEDDSIAMVTMETKLDFETLEKACREKTPDEATLQIHKVRASNCLWLCNLDSETSTDAIQFYFENKNKSGGGPVEKVNFEQSEGTCYVYFKNYKVIDDVLRRKHELNGCKIIVKCYQTVLRQPEGGMAERHLSVPEPISLSDENIVYKMKYIKKSKQKQGFEDALSKSFIKIIWPSKKRNCSELHCTLTKNVKGCFKLCKNWKEKAHALVADLLQKYALYRIDILQVIKEKVVAYIKTVNIEDPSEVTLFTESEKQRLIIVGNTNAVSGLHSQVQKRVKEIIDEEEKEKQVVTEIVQDLKPIELMLLKETRFDEELKHNFGNLEIRVSAEDVIIKGMASMVRKAKQMIHEHTDTFVSKTMDISEFSVSLYKSKITCNYVQQKLKDKGITSAWIVGVSSLEICCTREEMLSDCENIIRTTVVERSFRVNQRDVPVTMVDKWHRKMDEMNSKNSGKLRVVMDESFTSVSISATNDVIDMISEEIRNFMKANTLTSKCIVQTVQKCKLLQTYRRVCILDMRQKLQPFYVEVNLQQERIEIRGLPEGVDEAEAELQSQLMKVHQKSHSVKKLGVAKHMNKISESIKIIEKNHECLVEIAPETIPKGYTAPHVKPDETNSTTGTEERIPLYASCAIFGGRRVFLWKGDMIDMEVDVIVHPTDANLNFESGLGRSVLSKGGYEIQCECIEFATRHGPLHDISIFMSSAGNLKAKYIAHIKNERWTKDQGKERKLEASVIECLAEMKKRRVESVAIPAIGCGQNCFPVEISTRSIVRAIKTSFQTHRDNSVSRVYLCDASLRNIEEFKTAVCEEFGEHIFMSDENSEALVMQKSMGYDFGKSDVSTLAARPKIRLHGSEYGFPTLPKATSGDDVIVGSIRVSLVKGEIAKEKVDVIVNTANNSLDLSSGAVSISLSQEAGPELREEIRSKYPIGIKDGKIAETQGHNLNCSLILHCAMKSWNRHDVDQNVKALHKVMEDCMNLAEKHKFTSMAFPALGTGNLGFPSDVVASEMFEAVSNFQPSVLQTVKFIVYYRDIKTIQAFEHELKQRQGKTLQQSSTFDYPQNLGQPDYSSQNMFGKAGQNIGTNKVTVKVVKGEMARQMVDVIVNTTSSSLDLKRGAVSASLLKKAGQALQDEVTTKYPKGITDGELALTSGYNLNCQLIIHSSLNTNWNAKSAFKCKTKLQSLVKDCMERAEALNFTTIAFPAIGTGNLGFPCEVVASEMFAAVKQFSATRLTEVRFVVYDKDIKTVQAFENELQIWNTGGKTVDITQHVTPTQAALSYFTPTQTAQSYVTPTQIAQSVSDNTIDGKKIGILNITIKEGDITNEKCDAIVNSSNEDLDLSQGGVAKALLNRGGVLLEEEIEKQKPKMKREQLVVTSAPGFPCKHIIHVAAAQTNDQWKQVVLRCLKEAEQCTFTSIAFPALGTGIGMKAGDIAGVIYTAVSEFETTSPQHLTDIRCVIFQKDMVEEFKRAFKADESKSKKWSVGRLMKSVKDKFKLSQNSAPPISKRSKEKSDNADKVVFEITGFSSDSVEKVIQELDERFEKDITKNEFKIGVKKIGDATMTQIESIADQSFLELEYDQKRRILKVSGFSENVHAAINKIHEILRDAELEEERQNSAEFVSSLVQWSFIFIDFKGQELMEYDKALNYKIEKAYSTKDASVSYTWEGNTYIVDFSKMIEYKKSDPNDAVTVIRKERMEKVNDGTFELPTQWAPLQGGNLRVVVLKEAEKEYKDIEKIFMDSSRGSFKVSKIERVQNKTLFLQYQAKKKYLMEQKPKIQSEQFLWHGTSQDVVDNINAHGFNRSYCGKNATRFGDGVYFAVDASYSCRDTYSKADSAGVKTVYYCRVLTGEYTEGKQGMRVPPPKSGGNNTEIYDSVVDKMTKPDMFVIFHDTQAYPDYLVSFTKNDGQQ